MTDSLFFKKITWMVFFGLTSCLVACAPAARERTTDPEPITSTLSPTPSSPPQPSQTPTTTLAPATPSPSPTPTSEELVCSPLREIEPAARAEAIVNPFSPPPPGSDDFHQGVDLADLDPVNRIALTGRPVQAVLAGRVAAIIDERFPYGNAVLIETPFDSLPPGWFELFSQPTPVASPVPTNLSCPEVELPPLDPVKRSLYLLYAHLEENPDLLIDGLVDCGVRVGSVGSSGNALNPHLHFEVRVGPSGARFPSMAHYDTGASPEEMAGYCAWRVSGTFQVLDPMALFYRD